MAVKIPVSVLIITKDEEKNMRDCLESVRWADEIFVIDSGSKDATLEIAKEYTPNICYHAFENFASQRNWAQKSLPIKNEWVFHLDADERATPELSEELKRIFSSSIDEDGFMMPRRTIFRGRWIKHGGHYPVYQLRIFKKDKGLSEERLYDQNYIVNGKVSTIEADIINIINPDLKAWRQRHRRWAYLEAREVLFNKGRVMNIGLKGSPIENRNWLRYRVYYNMPLFIRAFLYFFYRYVIRLGFLDAREGLIFHFWQGLWYRLLVDFRIYGYMRHPHANRE